MAVNSSRSMLRSMHDGATDGKYRKVAPDREPAPNAGVEKTLKNREHLHAWYNYGYPGMEVPVEERYNPGS